MKTEDRIEPRLPRGFRDILSSDLVLRRHMIDTIQKIYSNYGYMPLETPALEYLDALGKFLPDSDQPEAGVFGFKIEEQWLALRYDLTAPLSRYVAMNKDLPLPFKRCQVGPVWRLEKPGPGRYREFYQFDIDIVGCDTSAGDAEICMALADSLRALGFSDSDFLIRISNRKVLNSIVEKALSDMDEDQLTRYLQSRRNNQMGSSANQERIKTNYIDDIFRCIDKLDRVGIDGVTDLLQEGRLDETGDFTPGCFLKRNQLEHILEFLRLDCSTRRSFLTEAAKLIQTKEGGEGLAELETMDYTFTAAGYDDSVIRFDSQIVRGLAYYTGPVFEATLTFPVTDESGRTIQFGSVAGGGRYDSLIERFTGQKIPATGASIGIDRLLVAYAGRAVNKNSGAAQALVTVMDKTKLADYIAMAGELRKAGIDTDLYLGSKGIRAQLKYADQKKIGVAVIAGEDEFAKGQITLKDLKLGASLSAEISERDKWRKEQPAQIQVTRERLVEEVKAILRRHG